MKFMIGIDEAGRGPLAGPVSVCALKLGPNLKSLILNFQKKSGIRLRDSKKLTASQREKWFEIIKDWQEQGKCDFIVSLVNEKTIDRVGINQSIARGITSSLKKLSKAHLRQGVNVRKAFIFLDGGLKAPKE